ncbi:MAG: hypothetical protein AAGC68_01855 [Verrucomicrobiota bacterium]
MKLFPSLVAASLLSTGAQSFEPNLGPDLHRVTVRCGEITLLLRQESQWTPGRFDFQGKPMTTEKSAYGTVFSFPGIGFIGSGHLENEPEKLLTLMFSINGKPVDPSSELVGETFRFERHSNIRGLEVENVIEVRNDRIYETARVQSKGELPLKLVYHFMHAWVPSASAFLALDSESGQVLSGELTDEKETHRRFYLRRSVDWVAIYDPMSRQFAVSLLIESPPKRKTTSKIWNVSGTYRKYYLESFLNDTIPADFDGTWKMVTGFGEADEERWEEPAKELANSLLSSP